MSITFYSAKAINHYDMIYCFIVFNIFYRITYEKSSRILPVRIYTKKYFNRNVHLREITIRSSRCSFVFHEVWLTHIFFKIGVQTSSLIDQKT